MNLKFRLITLLFLYVGFCHAQDMQEGFNFLETGKYAEAKMFFQEVLNNYPNNKTARLCYGRAIGLQGESEYAIVVFKQLLKEFPNDFEIKLNYAEALLWDKQYKTAKIYYEALIVENKKSFPALLGYANTLSNLKMYEDALVFVNKALKVSPSNPNALISKKYIHLGYANGLIQEQDYNTAESLLKQNFVFFKEDRETLINLANLYINANRFDQAENVYQTIGDNGTGTAVALNGLALVSHLKGDHKKALAYSKEAYDSLGKLKDHELTNQTKERYIQALIWNRKFVKAKNILNNLILDIPNEEWVLSLKAMLHTYKSEFKESVLLYNRILEINPNSFNGNLGKANALKALRNYDNAYAGAFKTLELYKNQKDALNFIKNLNNTFTPFIHTQAAFSFDNGDNEAYTLNTNIEFSLSTKFKISSFYSYRESRNTSTNQKATANNLGFGMTYLLHPNLMLKSNVGITGVNSQMNDYTQMLTNISVNTKPFKLQNLDLGFKREWQNFNADLLTREIVQNSLYLNYDVSTNVNLGWYTQYSYTWQNDDNKRNLLFTSLYYNISYKPLFKAGINYQYITFKNQVPSIYFSPKKFNVVEVFIDLLKNDTGKWIYNVNTATGFQFIEEQKRQSTYRIQGKVGYTLSNRLVTNIYGLHSNIASATATGFTYTEFGFGFKWDLSANPIFKIKEKVKD